MEGVIQYSQSTTETHYMRQFATIALCLAILSPVAKAETLRLKYLTTVEVVNDAGKVVETRKLKAGTVIAVEEPQAPAAKDAQKPAKGKKLVPADISPIMFKTTRPAAGGTLRAEVKLSDSYYGQFETQRAKFWSVDIYVYDAKWENSELFTGYISKSTPTGKKFAEFVKDGNSHRSVVKVAFAKDDTFDDLLEIQDFEPLQTNE